MPECPERSEYTCKTWGTSVDSPRYVTLVRDTGVREVCVIRSQFDNDKDNDSGV